MDGIEHSYKQIPLLACPEASETHGAVIMPGMIEMNTLRCSSATYALEFWRTDFQREMPGPQSQGMTWYTFPTRPPLLALEIKPVWLRQT